MAVTYEKYFQKWFETYKEPLVREVTLQRYLIYLNHIERSPLGKKDIKKIKRVDLQKFFNEYGKTRQKNTVLDLHVAIKSSFVDAVVDGLIKVNPCEKIEIISAERKWAVSKQIEERNKKKWLEFDEYKKMKMYLIGAINNSFHLKPGEYLEFKNKKNELIGKFIVRKSIPQVSLMMIYVALKTGARYSEILGLTREDVDFKEMTINIEKSYDYKYLKGFVPTKNIGSIRKVKVDKEFFMIMKFYFKWLEEENIELENRALFIKKGTRAHASTTANMLKRLLESLEIERITFHQLRHTHATILIAQGVSLQVIAKRLGHTDTSMIQRVYGHLLESTEEEENKKILELI